MNQAEWRNEGLESVFPPGWHYSNDHMPFRMTAAEAIVGGVPREMCAKSATWGTPDQAVKVGRDWIEAGATFGGLLDIMPLHTGAAGFPHSLSRLLKVAAGLKAESTIHPAQEN